MPSLTNDLSLLPPIPATIRLETEQSKFDTPDKELKPEEPEKELSTVNDEKLEVSALGNLVESPTEFWCPSH